MLVVSTISPAMATTFAMTIVKHNYEPNTLWRRLHDIVLKFPKFMSAQVVWQALPGGASARQDVPWAVLLVV